MALVGALAEVIIALLFGYLIAAVVTREGLHYVDPSAMRDAPGATFLWVRVGATSRPFTFLPPASNRSNSHACKGRFAMQMLLPQQLTLSQSAAAVMRLPSAGSLFVLDLAADQLWLLQTYPIGFYAGAVLPCLVGKRSGCLALPCWCATRPPAAASFVPDQLPMTPAHGLLTA